MMIGEDRDDLEVKLLQTTGNTGNTYSIYM